MGPLIESIYASKGLYQTLLAPLCKEYSLTDSEVVILMFIYYNDGYTATDIVFSQRLKKSVVSESLKDLMDKGLVVGNYLEGDRKSFHLSLTDDGKAIVKDTKKVQEEFYNIVTEGLSEEEKNTIKSSFKKINKNIRKYKKWV